MGLTEQLQTVRAELQLSKDIFIKKTTEQSRHLAWVNAAIISTASGMLLFACLLHCSYVMISQSFFMAVYKVMNNDQLNIRFRIQPIAICDCHGMEALSREFRVPYHGSSCMLITWLC